MPYFLRRCADYRDLVAAFYSPPIASSLDSLRRKSFIRLNTLPGKLSSWVLVMDGLPGDLLPSVLTLQQHRELSYAWMKARDFVHAALASLMSEPAQR
jgi:hypothetical protein